MVWGLLISSQINMAATSERRDCPPTKTSKQLLYAEKFRGTLLEQKLQIAGKKANLGKPCLPPPSSVLSRVKAFLPELQAANEKLKSVPQEEVDIEQVSADYDGPVIEMNLAIVPNLEISESDSGDSSSSDEESDDEHDEEKHDDSNDVPAVSDFLAPLNNQKRGRKRPILEMLGEEEKSDEEEDGT